MCINNTVRDVLSSHPHRQPLREAVATKRPAFDLGASLGLGGAHEPHLLVRHQHGHTRIWGFLFFLFSHVDRQL